MAIVVSCPGCGHRLEAGLRDIGRTIACPECSVPVAVPSMEAAPERTHDAVSFWCEGCGKSYRAGEELVGRTIRCRGCDAAVKVPTAAEAANRRPPKEASAPPGGEVRRVQGGFNPPASGPMIRLDESDLLPVEDEVDSEEVPAFDLDIDEGPAPRARGPEGGPRGAPGKDHDPRRPLVRTWSTPKPELPAEGASERPGGGNAARSPLVIGAAAVVGVICFFLAYNLVRSLSTPNVNEDLPPSEPDFNVPAASAPEVVAPAPAVEKGESEPEFVN